jgi:predicted  nucleic acid-binding Zn-ribbon protein
VSAAAQVAHLSDLDLLLRELADPPSQSRLGKLGLEIGGRRRLEVARARLAESVERRWMVIYERARLRYGRGVAAVRGRVCQGCFMTLPTSAVPRTEAGESLGLCQSCGRILYWG